MDKKEYLEWIKFLESKGYEDFEIEEIINDYLDQPENTSWIFIQD